MKKERVTPKIFVACLASYNAGHLHGAWVEALQDPDDMQEEIQKMLDASPCPSAEGQAIFDTEGFFGIEFCEYASIDLVSKVAYALNEHGPLFAELYQYDDLEGALAMMEDHYQGAFSSLSDWAEDFLSETDALGTLPANLRAYFNYEAFGRDAELSGDIVTFECGGEVHVFWAR